MTPKKIIITGTPCTGKTTVADLLGKKLKMPVTHITELVKEKKLGIRKESGAIVVSMKKLWKELKDTNGIIDGHLACELPLKDALVIVLRCRPPVLRDRMKKRKYPERKIKENLEAEALDYCTILAEKNYPEGKVFEIDTSDRKIGDVVDRCTGIVNGKMKTEKIDFSDYLPIE